jgi:hypothetical protein
MADPLVSASLGIAKSAVPVVGRFSFGKRKSRGPFIPGPAKKISRDCGVAQVEIREYIESRIVGLRDNKSISPKYAHLFSEALKHSPGKTNIMEMLSIIYDVGYPKPPTLKQVREKLLANGFHVP